MDRVNPAYIPRNHLVEEALDAARDANLAPFEALLAAVRQPFTERPGLQRYAEAAPEGFTDSFVTFCGT
jgi:serine/tyrosine/threonine adenylyltransferase